MEATIEQGATTREEHEKLHGCTHTKTAEEKTTITIIKDINNDSHDDK